MRNIKKPKIKEVSDVEKNKATSKTFKIDKNNIINSIENGCNWNGF